MIRVFRIFLIAGCAGTWAQVQLGAGSYLTSGGAVPGGTPYVTDDLGQAPKTAQWYSTLATTAFSGELYAHPASFKATAKGLEVDYPGAAVLAGNGFANQHKASLTVGIAGLAADAARVCGQSHFSVTARWKDASRTLEATIGHGLPFAYFKVLGGSATITHAGTVWYNQDGALGIIVAGKAFAVFAPTGSEWTGSGTLTSTLAGKDYLSVAVLPDASPETFAFFRRYAFSFVRKTVVGYAYQEQTAMVLSTYGVETEAMEGAERGTIFALLRHQWPEAVTPLSKFTYKSARGEMKVSEGPYFQTAMRFNGILPAMPDLGNDPATLARLVSATGGGVGGGDSYYSGKSMGKLAALAQLAEFTGNAQKRNEIVKSLEAGLEGWFKPGGQQLVYNKAWGALIGYPASFGSDTRLSDHHFHFGYFIMAAAIVAQWDPDWARPERYGGMVDMLIREVANWRDDDPLFARFRYFDAYEGHGWADGVGFPRGNNQESSSESMNCNAGIILWGINTGNKAIRDLGLFMYVNEARAIAQYWWDVDKAVFPAGYAHNAIGIVWSNGGAYTTWFSGDRSAIHGINFLPITAGHLYLGRHPDHVLRNYQEGNSGGWADLFLEYLAFADGDEAARKYGGGTGSEGGESAAHAYQHIKSLQAIGRLNIRIGADVPTFAVFDKAAVRTYTAFNPGGAAATVAFTDGFSMEVPAHTQVSRQGPVKAIPIHAGPRKAPSLRRGLWNSAADPYGSAWKAGILSADALGRRQGAADGSSGIRFIPPALSATPLP